MFLPPYLRPAVLRSCLLATALSSSSLIAATSNLTIPAGGDLLWHTAPWSNGVPGDGDTANLERSGGNNSFLRIAPGVLDIANLTYSGGINQLRIINQDSTTLSHLRVADTITAELGLVIFTKDGSGERFKVETDSVVIQDGGTLQVGRQNAGIAWQSNTTTIDEGGVFQVGWSPSGGIHLGAIENNGTLYLAGASSTLTTSFSVQASQLSGAGSQVTTAVVADTVTVTLDLGESTLSQSVYSGTISDGVGTVALRKHGSNMQVLTGANSYTGGTVIEGGVMAIANTTGSGLGSGEVRVSGAGVLAGSGHLVSSQAIVVESGGTIAPGAHTAFSTLSLHGDESPETLRMESGSSFRFRLGAGGTSDALAFLDYEAGDFILESLTGVELLDVFEGEYFLFSFRNAAGNAVASGLTSGLFVENPDSGFTFEFAYHNDVASEHYGTISLQVHAIPEPGVYAVLSLGAAVLGLRGFRRKSFLN